LKRRPKEKLKQVDILGTITKRWPNNSFFKTNIWQNSMFKSCSGKELFLNHICWREEFNDWTRLFKRRISCFQWKLSLQTQTSFTQSMELVAYKYEI